MDFQGLSGALRTVARRVRRKVRLGKIRLGGFAAMEQSNSHSAKQSRIVLVVEDEPAIREFLRMVLEGMGLVVLEANNGEEALAITRSFTGPIDLVISDVRMPKMDGAEMVYHLHGERPGIRVLLISGYSTESVPSD